VIEVRRTVSRGRRPARHPARLASGRAGCVPRRGIYSTAGVMTAGPASAPPRGVTPRGAGSPASRRSPW
jgi:hypothetical protein